MPLLHIWLSVPLVALGVLAVRRLCRRRNLPLPPLLLPLLAAIAWAVGSTVPPQVYPLPPSQRPWVSLADDLLLAFAAIRLLIWMGLELPGGLGWWRKPPELVVQLLSLLASAVAAVVILRQGARLDVLGLVATSAVLTAVMGLAAQDPLKDLISGIELQLADDFSLGDWIELTGGEQGIVTSISWRDCCLRTIEDVLLVVPNSKITADVLKNRSRFGRCSQRFRVGLDYSYPPAQAQKLLGEVVSSHPDVLSDPAPQVRVASFDDSAISYEIQAWVRTVGLRAQLDLRSALLSQIWYALRREGQSVPYPVRQLEPRRPQPPEHPDTAPASQIGAQWLRSTSLFADLSDRQRQILLESSRMLCFGPGEVIVREGAEGESLYLVQKGRVEVIKEVEGRQRLVAQLGESEVFGEMTLFLDAPRSATVRAVEESRLLRVDRPAVKALLRDAPLLLERFASLVAARQAELNHLSSEEAQERSHGLLAVMKRLFSAVAGN